MKHQLSRKVPIQAGKLWSVQDSCDLVSYWRLVRLAVQCDGLRERRQGMAITSFGLVSRDLGTNIAPGDAERSKLVNLQRPADACNVTVYGARDLQDRLQGAFAQPFDFTISTADGLSRS